MAFTQTDLESVQTAMIRLAVDGIAEATVGSETVVATSMDQLERLLKIIKTDLQSTVTTPSNSLRPQQWRPYYP